MKLSIELQDDTESGDLPFDIRIVQENYSPKLIVDNAREPVSVMSRGKRIALLDPVRDAEAESDCALCKGPEHMRRKAP